MELKIIKIEELVPHFFDDHVNFSVYVKTRKEKSISILPDRLYSTLQYQFLLDLSFRTSLPQRVSVEAFVFEEFSHTAFDVDFVTDGRNKKQFITDVNGWLQRFSIDEAKVVAENRVRVERIKALDASINDTRMELADLGKAIVDPIGRGVLKIDMSPGQAKWEADQAKTVADAIRTWLRE